ncbi:hypothetical protein X805_04970 [Sphaerotilus natans subsp. natans DSM 6575]|uniref:Uncharacterized protein n=1 Tax=Sphaerotilus natans subsp. natans DSM 6575 TaxID=1286631 RepID=A0A059KS62_9BURK|nr:hypothetical protein [Sphaerotilus natans]KDB53943.1 hypothetical protein X805_04970 [Sphaerotilus natans subsp. natans DSM 6575]SIR67694.1 hypothetical protein SAMN05421778_11461 [Sphaerotilus natans]
MASGKQVVVLVKQQTARNTPATLSASTDALLILQDDFDVGYERERTRVTQLDGKLNAPEVLPGAANFMQSLSVGVIGSGTAGAAPRFAALLKGGGFAETLVAAGSGITARAEYNLAPNPGSQIGLSMAVYSGDQLHPGADVFGTIDIALATNSLGKLTFKAKGRLNGDVSAAAVPNGTFVRRLPLPGSPTNTSKVRIGAVGGVTYANAALSGGTEFLMSSYSFSSGAKVDYQAWCGGDDTDISDAEPTIKIQCAMSASEYVAMCGRDKAGTGFSMGFMHALDTAGAPAAGSSWGMHAPVAKITSIKKTAEVNGQIVADIEASLQPSAPGLTDAVRLWFL